MADKALNPVDRARIASLREIVRNGDERQQRWAKRLIAIIQS